MSDERLRIEVDEPYLLALGRALFVFSGLEWNAVEVARLGHSIQAAAIGVSDSLVV